MSKSMNIEFDEWDLLRPGAIEARDAIRGKGLVLDEPAPAAATGKAERKDATIRVLLRADSGYKSESEARISPVQWGQVCAIMAGKNPAMFGQTAALSDVATERQRQVEQEGYSTEHDDEHRQGEMAVAASCYALQAHDPERLKKITGPQNWPWDYAWWKPSTPRRDLIKAAALILAEIERLDRLEGGAAMTLYDDRRPKHHPERKPDPLPVQRERMTKAEKKRARRAARNLKVKGIEHV